VKIKATNLAITSHPKANKCATVGNPKNAGLLKGKWGGFSK